MTKRSSSQLPPLPAYLNIQLALMSKGEDIHICYYSALLAKSLKLQNVSQYQKLYHLISKEAGKDKADLAKEKSRSLLQHPLRTLEQKIVWLEQRCGNKLELPDMESFISDLPETSVKKSETFGTNLVFSNYDSTNARLVDVAKSSKPLLDQIKFIDEDDEIDDRLTPRFHDRTEPNQFQPLISSTVSCSAEYNGHCTIDMHDAVGEPNSLNYDTHDKTLYTDHDLRKETAIRFVEKSSMDNDACCDEVKKKNKKKRKSKLKNEATSETVNVSSIPPAMVELQEFPKKSGESQPLLKKDDHSNSRRPIKNTSCDVKRYGSNESTTVNKAEKRTPKENPLQTFLTDEKVDEILEMCGDKQTLASNSKKKLKDSKSNASKKEKKKAKKPKKVEKKKAPDPHDLSDQDVHLTSTHPSPTEKKPPPAAEPGVNVRDEDSEEFVLQRRKKTWHKHSASGRTSPYKPETSRKRRHSDPSPAVPSDGSSLNQTSTNTQKEKWENTDDSRPTYDRSSQSQWPTLPSQSNAGGVKSVSGSASYASKLKTNMDSTGCSLASSSEETSSSSSSTNNYQTRSVDRASPVHDPLSALSDITKYIHEAAGFVGRTKSATSDLSTARLQPLNREVEPVDGVYEADSIRGLQASAKVRNDDVKKTPASTNAPSTTPKHDSEADQKPKEPNNPVLEEASVPDIKPSPVQEDDHQQKDILNTLTLNEFGLDFFVADLSKVSVSMPVVPKPDVRGPAEPEKEVTFGDGELQLDDISYLVADRGATSSGDVAAFSKFHFNFTQVQPEPDGDFDVKKASNALYQEWRKALAEGTFYKDL